MPSLTKKPHITFALTKIGLQFCYHFSEILIGTSFFAQLILLHANKIMKNNSTWSGEKYMRLELQTGIRKQTFNYALYSIIQLKLLPFIVISS